MKGDEWVFVGSCVDGAPFYIEGVNVWEHRWESTSRRVKVRDPLYHEDHVFDVCRITVAGKTIEFAAGEFSNCIWGFYVKQHHPH